MAGLTEQEMLTELRNYDTPAITNVVATYPQHPLCLGLYNPWTENWYTDQSIRCMYPELGRTVGYAVTCVYGLPDPNYSRLSFMDVIDATGCLEETFDLGLSAKISPGARWQGWTGWGKYDRCHESRGLCWGDL